jgi:hypothetical protein
MVQVSFRQSLLDIALQTAGGAEAAAHLAFRNDTGITESLPVGTILETAGIVNKGVEDYYRSHNICPATDITIEDMAKCPYGGIHYMGIEIDYTIS